MTQQDDELEDKTSLELEDILEWDIEEAEKAEWKLEDEMKWIGKIQDEINTLKESLARAQADYHNLVRRVERDREEMWAYMTGNIIAKILPFVDNLERIIAATPLEMQEWGLFDWIKSTYLGIIKTLEWMWIKSFISVGNEADANLHDVMSQTPGEEGKIIQEFEKWYMLGDKVIRHAKVVVGSGE
jgi:molecular chaperone GrpE